MELGLSAHTGISSVDTHPLDAVITIKQWRAEVSLISTIKTWLYSTAVASLPMGTVAMPMQIIKYCVQSMVTC